MNYTTLIKKLILPDGVTPPRRLVYDDIEAMAITRAHLERRRPGHQRKPRPDPAHPRRGLARRGGHGGVQLRRPRLARARVPRRRVVHLRRLRAGRLPGLLLPLPGGAAHPAHRGAHGVRRGRQLVGDARRLRARVLRRSSTPAFKSGWPSSSRSGGRTTQTSRSRSRAWGLDPNTYRKSSTRITGWMRCDRGQAFRNLGRDRARATPARHSAPPAARATAAPRRARPSRAPPRRAGSGR